MSPLHVTGRDRFVDALHAQFDAWEDEGELVQAIGLDGLAVLRLAAHEWVANLVQHAAFPGPAELVLELEAATDGVRCKITDTSRGFDFMEQVDEQQVLLNEPAPSERGRGLLMLVSCAEDLAFQRADDDAAQQIGFTVRAPEADMFASLFRPEDLAFDPTTEPYDVSGDGASLDVDSSPSSSSSA